MIILQVNRYLIYLDMVIINSYSFAVLLTVVTMLCWGSWGNTQKLATKEWPFQLFYWDYTFGIVLLSLAL